MAQRNGPMKALSRILIFLCLPCHVIAAKFPANTFYQVCFTPKQNCEGKIIAQINRAKHSILVQAYSFTAKWIAQALVQAHNRGVAVNVILDKSQFIPRHYSVSGYLIRHDVPVWEDYKPNIAHNKIMIFDHHTIETGSYNYTVSAQKYNTENILIIHNKTLAGQFTKHWLIRKKQSRRIKHV